MKSKFSQLSVLLIQVRSEPDMETQEQNCFLERCRLERHQLDTFNLASSSAPPLASFLEGYDALFIGGAGEYSATRDYPFTPFILDVVRNAYDRYLPTFGSCWGHQIIARALGGNVEHDSAKAELGCRQVSLTEEGKCDELFKAFPASFLCNMGHHDRVTELPTTATELAKNNSQPFEAFRIGDRPMYGTQFHSELDAHRERERLIRYRSYYLNELPSEEIFQSVLNNLAETTEVDHLMHNFLTLFAVQS